MVYSVALNGLKLCTSGPFQWQYSLLEYENEIQEFCKASNKIYDSYKFFKSGEFTFPKLKNIAKNLVSGNYFVNGNKLLLNDELVISNADELNNKIYEIEDKIKKVPEFQQIEKLLSDAKGIALRDVIENNPEIVEYLKLENLDVLKKELWASYIKKEEKAFNNLVENFNTLDEELKTLNVDESDWQKSLEIFEERFTVP